MAGNLKVIATGDGGQGFEFDFNRLGGVAGARLRLRHDDGETFPDEARVRRWQHLAGRLAHGGAVAVLVVGVVDKPSHPGGGEVRAGVDRDHAGHGLGDARINTQKPGVGVGGADKGGPGLPVEFNVVGELARAGQKARVFFAPDRLPDAELTHVSRSRRRRAKSGAINKFALRRARGRA